MCLVLAYPYAYVMSSVRGRLAVLLLIAVLLPFWSSILVRSYAWIVILGDTGLINTLMLDLGITERPIRLLYNLFGVVLGMVNVLLPFMVLPIYASMQRIDGDYMRAAANLGANPWQAFWRIYAPLSLPGVLAGALLVFVLALGFYITPALLGDPRQAMLGQAIATQVQQLLNFGMGSAMAMILLSITLVVLAVVSRVVRLGDAFSGGKSL
jgi:ABC-type spermidine/putrescine transport system permease subunit I